MKEKMLNQAFRPVDRVSGWQPLLILMFVWSMFGVIEARGQTVYVGIDTKTVEGFGKPGVKVWIGKYSVTTNDAGIGSLDIPAGTYTARAETKCRVARATASSNLLPSRSSSELVLTITIPQELPAGILFELDCKNLRARGKTKGKTVREKRPGNE